MKEASGEANMTIVTIILIGVVAALGYVIITNLMNSTSKKATCVEDPTSADCKKYTTNAG